MTYSLLDPNDWEAWQRQQQDSEALGTLLPPDSGLGGPPPMAAYQAPPHAEMAPLQLDTGPDWSDALGVGTTALASLADLALNHGRGTGQILAAGGQFGQARAEQRLRGTQDALAYEEKRAQLDKSNKYNDYLYANMAQRGQNQQTIAQQRGQNIDLRARDVGVKEANSARAAENQDPSEFIAWAAKRGYDLNGLQTMSQARSAMGPLMKEWDLEHAGDKAQAARTGTIAADLAAAPDTTAVAADKAGQVAAAQAPYRVDVAEGSAAARVRGQNHGERQVGGGIRIPGLVPVDPDVAAQNAGDPATLAKIQTLGGPLASARDALKEMAAIRKQYGTELPGEAKSRFDMAQVAINGAMTKIGETGVLSNDERKYYMSMIPGLSLGWTDALRPGGVDIKQQQLAGALQEFGNLANGKLRAYGWGLDSGAPRQQPSAAAGPANYGPDTDHPSNLGQAPAPRFQPTPGGARAQAQGRAPMGGGSNGSSGSQAVQQSDGSFDIDGYTYTAEEVQRLRSLGAIQ